MSAETPLLQFRGIVKTFGGTRAVRGVDLTIESGTVHALLGANGAGKSTLIKILAGVHHPDSGAILFQGRAIHANEIDDLPIAFIHQDLGLFEWMTVAENIALVTGYPRRGGLIDWRQIDQRAAAALETIGSGIAPQARIADLSRTERSIVAIARAIATQPALLVLDEPTSSLPQADVARLFAAITRLRTQGVGMIYVSHRLDEVFQIADHVTVMRDGLTVCSQPVAQITPQELVLHIVGRPPTDVFVQALPASGRLMVQVDQLRVGAVGPVSFAVRAGEVLGLCGLRGAGQNEVGRALCGIERSTGGRVQIEGQPLRTRSPRAAIGQGIGFVSSKREEESLGTSLLVSENLFLNPALQARHLFQLRQRRAEMAQARAVAATFTVRPTDPNRIITTLSGGNQQKVVLARWLSVGRRLLVLEEPTLGVDVGAKADIYALLNQSLAQGNAVILVSSDLEEVAGVCHRALIFNRGSITAEVPRAALSVNRLTALVGGATDQPTEGQP